MYHIVGKNNDILQRWQKAFLMLQQRTQKRDYTGFQWNAGISINASKKKYAQRNQLVVLTKYTEAE